MEVYSLIIEEIEKKSKSVTDKKISKVLNELTIIFSQMDSRGIPASEIDELLKRLKKFLASGLRHAQLLRLKIDLLDYLRKQHGIVTPHYYRNLWMMLGMTIFGLPFGLMFAMSLDNMAFFSIGLPIGMPIGMAIGAGKDKKAADQGLVIGGLTGTI